MIIITISDITIIALFSFIVKFSKSLRSENDGALPQGEATAAAAAAGLAGSASPSSTFPTAGAAAAAAAGAARAWAVSLCAVCGGRERPIDR